MFVATIIFGFLLVGVHSQGQLTMEANSDASSKFSAKVPLGGTANNKFSAFAAVSNPSGAISKGLSLDNVKGHGLSVSHTNLPGFGEQLTGAGRVNLVHNPTHNLDANAFVTRNIPNKFPGVPNFNTVGGNLDYTFKDRVGATLSAAHTPFLHQTDYSAMGKLNLYRSPSTSFDFNAGLQKTVSPHFSHTQPFTGFSLSRFFKK